MPKWLLYGLGAILDFGLSALAYMNDRTVVAAILALAGVLFVIAAIGALVQSKKA